MFPPKNPRELQIKLEKAIKAVILSEFPEVTVKVITNTTLVEPLAPTGWKFELRLNAQVTPLDKKKEAPE